MRTYYTHIMTRLFFALEIVCPWPQNLPKGKILLEQDRHMTLAFLGEQEPDAVMQDIVKYQLKIAPIGYFDQCQFISSVVCWHMKLLSQKEIAKDLLPHVTMAREPFDKKAWQETFVPLPFIANAVHLYESLGNSRYKSLKKITFIQPFEEFEHTADIAFFVRAQNMQELYFTAAIALSFHFLPFLQFIQKDVRFTTLDEIISSLNTMIAHADSTFGCPLKAVSYHGEVIIRKDSLLEWEMIVDV